MDKKDKEERFVNPKQIWKILLMINKDLDIQIEDELGIITVKSNLIQGTPKDLTDKPQRSFFHGVKTHVDSTIQYFEKQTNHIPYAHDIYIWCKEYEHSNNKYINELKEYDVGDI